MNLASVTRKTVQASLNKYNIVIVENYGLNFRTGFWWLVFTFDYGFEKEINVRLTNFKYKRETTWTLELTKCQYLGITNEEEMASFDMEDELINSEELKRLQSCGVSNEKLRGYLEANVVPLVTKKIKYSRFKPQFTLFLSHKTKDKPLMRSFENGLKFLGYETWIDQSNIPLGATLQGALKTGVEECDTLIAWLTVEYMESDYCRAELLYAKEQGKILILFGVMQDIGHLLTGAFEFLRDYLIYNPNSSSFFEILRRMDDSLFNFETLAI